MSRIGAAPRAAVPVSGARAEASRKNGAKSRGPRTPEGKARSAQNALKHGMRAQKFLVLPDEDAAEFEALEAALVEELAPVGALQAVLARRVAVAAWRLARADRIETELFEERRRARRPGPALIRDGNGALVRDLLRYRGAAMAEFWRALRTLKALQAEQAGTRPVGPPRRVRRSSGVYHKRTRALPPAPARHADPRAQPRSARVAGDLATERTRAHARQPAPGVVERAGARTIRRTRPCRNEE